MTKIVKKIKITSKRFDPVRKWKILFLFLTLLLELFFLFNNAAGKQTYILGISLAMTISWMFFLWKGERIEELRIFREKKENDTVWYLRSGLSYVAGVVWFFTAVILDAIITFVPPLNAKIDSWISTDKDMVFFLIIFMTLTSGITFLIVDRIAGIERKGK